MNIKMLAPILLVLFYGQALAVEGKISLNTPAHGALISADTKLAVNYEAMLGPKGDHLHLYVDDKRIDVLRQLKGSYDIGPLLPGKHKICLTENTKWHMSTGLESCVDVVSQ
ncbi:MAG: hypothetical protein WAW02_10305 [Sideroxyarcus sp.]